MVRICQNQAIPFTWRQTKTKNNDINYNKLVYIHKPHATERDHNIGGPTQRKTATMAFFWSNIFIVMEKYYIQQGVYLQ